MSQKPPGDDRGWEQPALSDEIDLICDDFEQAWLRGEPPPIEDFLQRGAASLRRLLLAELVLVDREYRIQRGEGVDRQRYQQQFPDYSTVIEGLEFATIAERNGNRSSVNLMPTVASPGSKIASFELLEELGSGASGTVWKASDTRLRRTVAIKIPCQEILNDALRERFLREGQACAQLRHPNIVAIHEVGEDRGRAFIVAEFVDGVDLREWLSRRRPTPREAAELVAQIAEALHHAHEQGVIHRDLKPANVILDRDDQPHITDFGLAKWAADPSEMTLQGELLGTPAYMSPEQAQGDAGRVDRRTDVFALGVILYEMLTGRRPFEGEHAALIDAIVRQEPRLPSVYERSIPRDLDTICLKSLEKKPSNRYATAQEMAVDLRRFLRGEQIVARPARFMEKVWRWLRRRPAVAIAGLLLLLTAASLNVANKKAAENRKLMGYRTTAIATKPSGARIAFVPLHKLTGEPNISETVYAAGYAPLTAELRPGDYLVVALLPDGRFHEVIRHVPSDDETLPAAYYHRSWEKADGGTINLPQIPIPPADVDRELALIVGSDRFLMGIKGSDALPAHERRVASFRVAAHEFTCGDYKRMFGQLPRRLRDDPPPDGRAFPASYDLAVAIAEDIGMRLPTEVEYEYLATNGGKQQYPWGHEWILSDGESTFGPVGGIALDCLPTSPRVYGLCSNVAEWTSSRGIPYPPHPVNSNFHAIDEYRIVRGGDKTVVDGAPHVTPQSRNPRDRTPVIRYNSQDGVGFRCVRSEQPMIQYHEFP